ncbi:hypothetical protein VPH35_075816 [Triticum aestivum]
MAGAGKQAIRAGSKHGRCEGGEHGARGRLTPSTTSSIGRAAGSSLERAATSSLGRAAASSLGRAAASSLERAAASSLRRRPPNAVRCAAVPLSLSRNQRARPGGGAETRVGRAARASVAVRWRGEYGRASSAVSRARRRQWCPCGIVPGEKKDGRR